MRPLALFVLVTLWIASDTERACADQHVACHNCGALVKVTESGAGFRREDPQIIHCADCVRDRFRRQDGELKTDLIDRFAYRGDEWFDQRYVFFEDGTFIDMGHFFAAADVATLVGADASWGIGWGVEWFQEFNEWLNDSVYQSGAPFGANEDVLSNTLGALYGDHGYGEAVTFVEAAGVVLGYGTVSHSSNQKPR